MPFEHHRQPVAPHHVFLRRLANHLFITLTLIAFTLGLGVLGYRYIGGLPWLDALLESSMLMGGEGPIYSADLASPAAKIFASLYRDRVVPLIIPDFVYWGPILIFLYGLPLNLQVPFFLLAFSGWSLAFVFIGSHGLEPEQKPKVPEKI